MGKEPYSFSKKIKASVKKAVKHISDFEETATEIAIENKYDYVLCGHIHEPKILKKTNKNGSTIYLNSGDWVENLTSLEYNRKKWKLYRYEESKYLETVNRIEKEELTGEQLIASIILSKNNLNTLIKPDQNGNYIKNM